MALQLKQHRGSAAHSLSASLAGECVTGTPAEGAVVHVNRIPVTFRCEDCGTDFEFKQEHHRLDKLACPSCGACHLDIPMVEPALNLLDLDALDVVFVENIGNLVCPAEFDIGEALKVMTLSVPEGDDKTPQK